MAMWDCPSNAAPQWKRAFWYCVPAVLTYPEVSDTMWVTLLLHLGTGSVKGTSNVLRILCQKWVVENLRELQRPFRTWLCSFTAQAREWTFSCSFPTQTAKVQIYNQILVTQNIHSLTLVPASQFAHTSEMSGKANVSLGIFEMGWDFPATAYFPSLK